jgi:integrase
VPPTIFQINELIGKTPERYKVAVLFAALSGLRKGEQFALRRGDLNLIQGTVTVEISQLKLRNKPLTYGEPKSEAGKRNIALPQLLVERLKNHLENFSDSNLDSLVFTTESGSPVQKLGSWWDQARKELEFTYTWHDLRHTAGV